ncbi:hypothetical protein SAMN05192583_0565 [Sphingomonas gellani]|uniref:Uncharacterized protein n=1 Tax=Sphingomonas gellani TaxID=1166340 RepID=A0A1H7Z857_9SPHN|nr:hypothetical protein [Sphingomonas gellani]SEM54204.1 hypothetical protein SAMN05192583_0565 [Sphingomonas gellani]
MSTRADRQRKYRQRQNEGVAVYRVPANYDILDALITDGRITEQEALNKQEVERALARVVVEWAFNFFVTHNAAR